MAKVKEVQKAKLFVGVLYSNEKICKKVIGLLVEGFGEIEKESEPYAFDFTDYYEGEMGKNLMKKFIVFKEMISMDELADIKIFTNGIEDKFAKDRKRVINLDPGYLNKEQLVLASVKGSAYKVYLDKGIYAHLILIFKKNSCIELNRTFPDFREKKVQDFFIKIRDNFISGFNKR